MSKNLSSYMFLFVIFLTSCASTSKVDPNDVVPAPQMAKSLEAELAKVISSSQCRIVSCVNMKTNQDHFICKGEYSYISSSTAHEKFRIATEKLITKNARIDFTAYEGFGSRMLNSFLKGLVGGIVVGAIGGHRGHYHYIGGTSSSVVKFTLPINGEIN